MATEEGQETIVDSFKEEMKKADQVELNGRRRYEIHNIRHPRL